MTVRDPLILFRVASGVPQAVTCSAAPCHFQDFWGVTTLLRPSASGNFGWLAGCNLFFPNSPKSTMQGQCTPYSEELFRSFFFFSVLGPFVRILLSSLPASKQPRNPMMRRRLDSVPLQKYFCVENLFVDPRRGAHPQQVKKLLWTLSI